MGGHVFLSLEHLAGNSCKVSENVLCPAVIVSPVLAINIVTIFAKMFTIQLEIFKQQKFRGFCEF